jgi:pimeloyl-ACP methyl ester carboxylesterase
MNYLFNDTIKLQVDSNQLSGELVIPLNAQSLVLFSHGSGSSRFSPRNNFVAHELQRQNVGTFLFDLLTNNEDEIYSNRFDIELHTNRLICVTNQISQKKECKHLVLGYFGASTGAASALKAAAALPSLIHTIVSRGGRSDLALDVVKQIQVPVLLIVGELDYDVIRLNRQFYEKLNGVKKLKIVPKATHLFEEVGALQEVTSLAADWFSKYLSKSSKNSE